MEGGRNLDHLIVPDNITVIEGEIFEIDEDYKEATLIVDTAMSSE